MHKDIMIYKPQGLELSSNKAKFCDASQSILKDIFFFLLIKEDLLLEQWKRYPPTESLYPD